MSRDGLRRSAFALRARLSGTIHPRLTIFASDLASITLGHQHALTKAGARGLLLVWIGVIAFLVVPWGRFHLHPHVEQVQWIPFVSPPIRLRDIVMNALLYLPVGYWHVKQGGRPSLWRTGTFALALSVGTELTQLFSDGRFPSTTDVTCNTLGALGGARWAMRKASNWQRR